MLGIGVEMFEHLPSLLGRQLEHCFLAFTQAQPLHEPVRLHLQHSTIALNYSVKDIWHDVQQIIGASVSEPRTSVFNCDFS